MNVSLVTRHLSLVTLFKAFITSFLITCFSPSQGQTVNQLIKAGDKKFDEGEYYVASQYYADALKKDEENPELNYKFAEAARMFNDYATAIKGYTATAKFDYASKYPLALFWLGEMLKSSCECKYRDAIKQFQKFKGKYREKDYYSAKAQQEIESCSWALDHLKTNDAIKVEHLGKEINTNKSEFNPIPVYPDRLQFSALRNISADEKHPQYLSRIYNQPPNPEAIFVPNGSNSSLHIGNGIYSADVKSFYFTQCEQTDKTNTRCDIYVSRYRDYKWTPAEKLSINDPQATNTHPAIGNDAQGNEVLFFASDRAGGHGQMDIWLSKIDKDGSFNNPINPGEAINTKGNEVTPWFDINEQKLYFSSNWHYGFGGYDVFETKGEYVKWSEPKNLLLPANSAQNDLYYVLTGDNTRAYLTSNRKGSYFIEAETCCNDIYAYNTGMKIEKRDTAVVLQTDTPETQEPIIRDTLPQAKNEPIEPKKFIDDKVRKIKQLLPVTLYFHNDEPDCCNLRDTTSLDYKQTYEVYSAKLSEYNKQFSKGLGGAAKTNADQQIFKLFTDKVDKGFYDLVAFSSQLLDLLSQGNKLEITIKGYCSPLNYNEYNIHLGNRRVASLRNYFFHYREGILLKHIADGSLVLKNESLGEETAAKDISDKLEDTRNSVYNPAAALERRVEIVSVELK